jgi:RimJ/RimL family protein N-acetyltransferase
MAAVVNTNSIKVMEKIGMQKTGVFKHPLLVNDKRLEDCVLYKIENQSNNLL